MAKASKPKEENLEKKSKFEEAKKKMEDKYGKGTIISGKELVDDYEVISTGSLHLNLALGTGGYPLGTLIEIQGPFSSGKSTLTLHAIHEFQKQYPDDECVLMDGEHSYDKKYAAKLGVNTDKVTISQPTSAEDMYNIAETLIKTGEVRLIVIDSHTSFLPQTLINNEVGQVTIAPYGRTNSVALGKIKALLKPNRCTIIALSQLRVNVGGYGSPEKSTGGKSWEFYPDIKIKLQKKEVSTEKEANKTVATVTKNKCAKPFGVAEFEIAWGEGINRMKEIIDAAIEFKLIDKGGSWYTVKNLDTGEQIHKCQGEVELRKFLEDNESYMICLEELVINKLKEE